LPHYLKVKNLNTPAAKREAEDWGRWPKRSPVAGAESKLSTSQKFLGANAGGTGIVARFFAVLFVHLFLLLAGLTGFLLLLLLLVAMLLLTAAALLVLLFTLVRHSGFTPCWKKLTPPSGSTFLIELHARSPSRKSARSSEIQNINSGKSDDNAAESEPKHITNILAGHTLPSLYFG
jgi:hypothetical protein